MIEVTVPRIWSRDAALATFRETRARTSLSSIVLHRGDSLHGRRISLSHRSRRYFFFQEAISGQISYARYGT